MSSYIAGASTSKLWISQKRPRGLIPFESSRLAKRWHGCQSIVRYQRRNEVVGDFWAFHEHADLALKKRVGRIGRQPIKARDRERVVIPAQYFGMDYRARTGTYRQPCRANSRE